MYPTHGYLYCIIQSIASGRYFTRVLFHSVRLCVTRWSYLPLPPPPPVLILLHYQYHCNIDVVVLYFVRDEDKSLLSSLSVAREQPGRLSTSRRLRPYLTLTMLIVSTSRRYDRSRAEFVMRAENVGARTPGTPRVMPRVYRPDDHDFVTVTDRRRSVRRCGEKDDARGVYACNALRVAVQLNNA